MSDKTRITTIVGTRPEIIRLASIIKRFDMIFDHRFIHTGQNSQHELSGVFFKDLALRQPDLYLGIQVETLGKFLAELFTSIETELTLNRPDAIVILGDTNSALISILAKRMRIPVYHLEAGNRSFDSNVPEEINRKIIDHSSDFNLCYTSHAARNLDREGIHPRFVSVIGSPLREVIDSVQTGVQASNILDTLNLQKNAYFVVSIHRQENIDLPGRLQAVISCINRMATEHNLKTIVSAHPRFVDKLSKQNYALSENVQLIKPLGYLDFLKLQSDSRLVISDSGSISEEAAILGIKAMTIRDSMERPEALEAGSILLAGTEPDHFMKSLETALSQPISKVVPHEYLIPDSSTRVVNFIQSTVSQFKFWSGTR